MVSARSIVVAIGLIVVAAFTAAPGAHAQSWQALVSPAPLSPGHKQLEGDCDKCHLVFSGVPNEKCLGCHAYIATKQTSGKGFHADVAKQSCQACHVDHQGSKGAHTKKTALAEFDHQKTMFALQGAHAAVKCAECHKPASPGGRGKIEPQAACNSCHEDTHKGGLGERCASCHAATGWKDSLKTLASHKLPTHGGHQGLTCKDCHEGGRVLQKESRCIDCHKSDQHGGGNVSCEKCHQVTGFKPAAHNHDACTCTFPGKHQTFECIGCHKGFQFAGTPTLCSGCHDAQRKHEPLGECSRCHTATSWKENRFDHNTPRSKFLIQAKHLEVACNRCHVEKDKKGRQVFRAAEPDCRACHQQTGDAAHGDFGTCNKCHDTTGFEKTTFEHFAATGFALAGKHAAAKCQSCHAEKTKGYPGRAKAGGAKGAANEGDGPDDVRLGRLALWLHARLAHAAPPSPPSTPSTPAPPSTGEGHGEDAACVHCHADPHAGQVGTSCASCHEATVWTPSTFSLVRHAQTKMALLGKHATAKCSSCHTGGKLTGLPISCAGCHVDRHRGKLGDACQTCHTTAAFVPAAAFEHTLTGFTITKQHAKVGCVKCHGVSGTAAVADTVSGAAPSASGRKDLSHVKGPLDCKSCHKAGHATFEVDCVACHLPDDAMLAAASGARTMDHRDTGFALERSHKMLACKSCHTAGKPQAIPRCASCHQEPHGGQAGIECADCHQPDRFSLVRFNHDRTSWALRGRHFLTPCNECHVNERWVGLRTECFDCHALDAGRAKAKVGGHAPGAGDCRDCHRSVWRW